jgi:pentatricopeptide repeat protein
VPGDRRPLQARRDARARPGAQELFDWLAGLGRGHPAAALCDVYTFTAAIALCAPAHQLDRALGLARQMRGRGVRGNVFSYSALLNVCVKCGQLDAGLEVWGEMERSGVPLNVRPPALLGLPAPCRGRRPSPGLRPRARLGAGAGCERAVLPQAPGADPAPGLRQGRAPL